MAKHLRGKTFTVGIENEKTFAVAASFNNECLWLVHPQGGKQQCHVLSRAQKLPQSTW